MDLFSTNALVAAIRDLRLEAPPLDLLSLFFPTLVEETSEEIHFDTEVGPRRVAPFVSPLVEGKLVESQGYVAKTFKPAYVKDKRVFDANRPMKRAYGEPLTGNLSPAQRMQILVAQDLRDQIAMLRRRKLLMAAEALRLGQVTVAGDGYPTTVVSFGRAAGLTISLTGGALEWDDAGVSPVDNVEDWSLLVQQTSGAIVTDIVFEIAAWRLFRADTKFAQAVDLLRGRDQSSLDLGPRMARGASLRGTLGNLRLWTYQDWYVDTAGVEQPVLPQYTVLGVAAGPDGLDGQQCHGAIRDEDAGFQAMEYFPKSWTTQDPSVRYLLLQSAPLVVPFRVNASFAAVVS